MADETNTIKCRVGPWINKDEFNKVYNLLYSSPSDSMDLRLANKRQAYQIIKMWSLRTQALTPASIMSTLILLDVQIKDLQQTNGKERNETDLRICYSNAFIKFLNYMSSIMQGRGTQLQSMYNSADDLGIESFIVDLRHLCSHGHITPTLDVFQQSAEYCMTWLKTFYWDREQNIIENITVHDVRLRNTIESINVMKRLLIVYDCATEAVQLKCRVVEDCDDLMSQSSVSTLKQFSEQIGQNKLKTLAALCINELTVLACRINSIHQNATLFCSLIFDLEYFMNRTAKIAQQTPFDEQSNEKSQFIQLHQNLFRSMAISGFIDQCFDLLLEQCELEHESIERRLAASFWANQIVKGFILFQDFKQMCKMKKDRNMKFEIDLAPINTEIMSNEIRDIYKRLGVNCHGVLLFGDTIRRPWCLSFTRDYIQLKLINANQYTLYIIEKCIQLCDPPFNAEQKREIITLTNIYTGMNGNDDMKIYDNNESAPYLTVDDLQQKLNKQNDGMKKTICPITGNQKYGIWTVDSSKRNWSKIPFGQLL